MANENIKAPEVVSDNEKQLSKQAEYKRARREADKKAATSLLEKVEKANLNLTKEENAFLHSYADYDPNASQRSDLFVTMFPKGQIGESITLEKIILATLKGRTVINKNVEKWKEKGIVVEITQNDKEPLKATYTLKALPKE